MSVVEFKLNKSQLIDTGLKALNDGDFSNCAVFSRKLLDIGEYESGMLLLSKMYDEMGQTSKSNNCLFKLYQKQKDRKYLEKVIENLVKEDSYVEAMRYSDYGLGEINEISKINLDDVFEFMNAMEKQNAFKIVYPVNDEYLDKLLEKARELTATQQFAQSNKLLNSRDFSKLDGYINVIRLKAINYMNLGDLIAFKQFASDLISNKDYELYGRVYMMYYNLQDENLHEARKNLDRVLEFEPEENIILALPIMLVTTPFNEQCYKISKIIIDNYNYGVRDVCYKAILEYILSDTKSAYKTLSFSDKMFGKSSYTFIIRKLIEYHINAATVDIFMQKLDYYINDKLSTLTKLVKNDNIDEVSNLILEDEEFSNIFDYVLRENNIEQINIIIRILNKAYNDNIGLKLRDLIIDGSVLENVKTSLIKTIIEYDSNQVIAFVLGGLYVEYDFTYPLDHYDTSVVIGYYDALLFAFATALKANTATMEINENLLILDDIIKDKKVDITSVDARFITIYLCFNGELKNEIRDINRLFEFFDVPSKDYYEWYNTIMN